MSSRGKLWTRRYKKTQKNQLSLLKSLEQSSPLHTAPPKAPLQPDPWTCPTFIPYKESVHLSAPGADQGNLLFSLPSIATGAPNKTLPDF